MENNSLSNRLYHINDQIPLTWLNASSNTFKVNCKKMYLNYWIWKIYQCVYQFDLGRVWPKIKIHSKHDSQSPILKECLVHLIILDNKYHWKLTISCQWLRMRWELKSYWNNWRLLSIRNSVHFQNVTIISDDWVGLNRVTILGNHQRL